MPSVLPSPTFAFTWSYLKRFDCYCVDRYVVTFVGDDTVRFDDPLAPGQPGFFTSHILFHEWNSNHYTLDRVMDRVWYVDLFSVEHEWGDWAVELAYDPDARGYVMTLAVAGTGQLFLSLDVPPPPEGYWLPS